MTRVTNFGRKRTYVEAGFSTNATVESAGVDVEPSVVEDAKDSSKEDNVAENKKRKRTKKAKAHTEEGGAVGAAPIDSGAVEGGDDQIRDPDSTLRELDAVGGQSKKSKGKLNQYKNKKSKGALPAICFPVIPTFESRLAASWRAEQSELRRQKRISGRQADTICFACRKKGHAAKDCPASGLDDALEDEAGIKLAPSIGICYRYDQSFLSCLMKF
jgi:zinc finger CCHC domain-containing protein 9